MIKKIYNKIRPYLPEKIAMYNGVAVKNAKLLDVTDVKENWKEEFIDEIRNNITPGDKVIEVGTGLGISAVVAARQVGKNGKVKTYEADKDRIDNIRQVFKLNKVESRVELVHGIVGDVKMSTPVEGKRVDWDNIGNCDVLILDCEGAEVPILSKGGFRTRKVIVETHKEFGAPEDKVTEILLDKGYSIERSRETIVGDSILVAKNG